MKKTFITLALAMVCLGASAQWQHQPTPNDTLQSVRTLDGGKVAFSIYAPNAKEVGFGGDASICYPIIISKHRKKQPRMNISPNPD